MRTKLAKFMVSTLVAFSILVYWQSAVSKDDAIMFVGSGKCKICHNKEETGAQFSVWADAKHSKAFELLATDEAKATAKSLGIDDPQKSPKCLMCHSTVYFFSETPVTNIDAKKDGTLRLTVEEGVSCESCHWAGSEYQPKKVMEDFDASVAAGMNPNPEESCVKCHNDCSPSWKNDRYTLADGSKVGFDFKQAWEKIKHPNPQAIKSKGKK